MARSDRDGAQDFNLDREIKKLTAQLTRDIRQKSEKAAVAREYEDHIYDAMQNYMLGGMTEEDAFAAARNDLGDIEEIAVTLGDIHNENKVPNELRKRILKGVTKWRILAVIDVIVVLVLAALPPQFWQACPWYISMYVQPLFMISYIYLYVIIILGGLNLLIWWFRCIWAIIKRIGALAKIKRYAAKAGLHMQVKFGTLTSIFMHPAKPAMILENDTHYFKIRFLTTVMRKRQLMFLGKNLYTVTKVQGGSFISPMAVSEEWMGFRPKNMEPMHRNVFVVAQLAVPIDAIALPTFECRHDPRGKTVKEILLFHPAPMAVQYQDGNKAVEISGGEEFDGVTLFGLSGFCKMLERMRG